MRWVDGLPLTKHERTLIRAAETQPWNEDLRWLLAEAVGRRGVHVGVHDSCGDLVDALEISARAARMVPLSLTRHVGRHNDAEKGPDAA